MFYGHISIIQEALFTIIIYITKHNCFKSSLNYIRDPVFVISLDKIFYVTLLNFNVSIPSYLVPVIKLSASTISYRLRLKHLRESLFLHNISQLALRVIYNYNCVGLSFV